MSFIESRRLVNKLLAKAKEVSKGKSLLDAEIDLDMIRMYGVIARRCRDGKDFGVTPYPFEQGPGVGALSRGFFEHREWPIRRAMERHQSLRAVSEYEASYVNGAGYWMALHEAALDLRQEYLEDEKAEDAQKCDVWAGVYVRYDFRVLGLRKEFKILLLPALNDFCETLRLVQIG